LIKRKHTSPTPKAKSQELVELRGWPAIAGFLGMPNSTAHRWAKEGMPVRRDGRNIVAGADELNHWLRRTSGEAAGVHVAVEGADLLKDLKASLAAQGKDAQSSPANKRVPKVKARVKNVSRKPSR
jgi:hypothetical protein